MNNIVFITILSIIILVSAFNLSRKENFASIFVNPGAWAAGQITGATNVLFNGLWDSVRRPVTFTRDVVYNFAPNYTMVDRLLVRKADLIRANNGLPAMNPVRDTKAHFHFNNKRKDLGARVGASIFY